MISFKKIFLSNRRLLCCLLFFGASCSNAPGDGLLSNADTDMRLNEKLIQEALAKINSAKSIVRNGDLVMRTGRDFTSTLMRQTSANDKTWSHCGIAFFENDSLVIYHALGGEWNPDEKLRRDGFEIFCNPYENRGFGIYRYDIKPDEEKSLNNEVINLFTSGIRFDMQFDLATNDRLYCTEFVAKTIEVATRNRIVIPPSIFQSKNFIAPDNLFRNNHCKKIMQTDFKVP